MTSTYSSESDDSVPCNSDTSNDAEHETNNNAKDEKDPKDEIDIEDENRKDEIVSKEKNGTDDEKVPKNKISVREEILPKEANAAKEKNGEDAVVSHPRRAALHTVLTWFTGRTYTPRTLLFQGLPILLVLIGLITLFVLPHFLAHATAPLPGQQIWKQGVSSWLFGTNDASWDWSASNPHTNPAIAATVKAAGITVIRTPLHSDDANDRVAVVEASGAQCLGILQPEDAEQVVKTLGNRCNLYEWMNEPDNGGPSASDYAASWNQEIPKLRALNPQALFIGPVVASPNTGYIKDFLTAAKASGNLPDIVSYHMYPCTGQSISDCPQHIDDYGQAAQEVNDAVQSVVGHTLPLAVTEWNYSWKPGETPQNDPYMATFTQQSIQAMAKAGIVMANQFDLASNAGGGVLDMVNPQTAKSTPQLQEMQTLIKQYSTGAGVTSTPVPVPSPTTTPSQVGTPDMVGNGALLSAQQLTCLAPSATNVAANTCNFLIQVKTPDESKQLLLTWWNEGATAPSKVQIALSGDSTDGHNGTWSTWPTSLTTGGVQLLSVPGQTHWISVHLEVPPSSTGPVIGAVELYTISISTPTPVSTPTPSGQVTPVATPTHESKD